jgi:hypothetical protein
VQNFLWVSILGFFVANTKLASNFVFNGKHNEILQKMFFLKLTFLLSLKTYLQETNKRLKHILELCARILFCIHFSSPRLHIVEKGQNPCTRLEVPNAHTADPFPDDTSTIKKTFCISYSAHCFL